MIRWDVDGYEVAFTTRLGGVSEGPYASLNLGRKSGDDVARADENRRIACAAIGADVARLALNYQVHSDRVVRAAPAQRGERADGLWTDEPGLPILAMSADCLPIAVQAMRRFSSTRSTSSPLLRPKLSDAYGPSLTPPTRVVNTTS